MTTNGTLTILASFSYASGYSPYAGLTLGNDGSFYGSTYSGGTSNLGTIFKITTNGTLTTLISFLKANGANPQAALTLGNDGILYGSTYNGGTSNLGTIFQVTTNGILTTLVSFLGTNGANPQAALTLGNDGHFYGTTYSGGSSGGGTIFIVTTNGTLTSLYSFAPSLLSGPNPKAGLTLGDDGNFYGTTYNGGTQIKGTVFRVTTKGVLTNLISFAGSNGANPMSTLTIGLDGNFYGTTFGGGSSSMGVIFRLDVPPQITAQPVNVTVTNGGSVSITATVSGTPLNYQWFMSSGRTATAVSYFVILPGQIQSVIISDGGAGYSSIPMVQFVGFGFNASGTAIVNNGAVTSIIITNQAFYFQKPKIVISSPMPVLNQPLTGQTNAVLTLFGVTSANTTNYFVVVTNVYGSVTSTVVGLTVFLPPQNFLGFSPDKQQLDLQLNGTPNYPYILQSATNLTPPIIWQSIFTNPADVNGNWSFAVSNLMVLPSGFYRAVAQ